MRNSVRVLVTAEGEALSLLWARLTVRGSGLRATFVTNPGELGSTRGYQALIVGVDRPELPPFVEALRRQLPIVVVLPTVAPETAVELTRQGIAGVLPLRDASPRELEVAVHVAIERWTRERRLRELATHDELTGLLNRRGFLDYAEARRQANLRARRPFLIAYMDVDAMRTLNNEFGHAGGDMALRHVADALRGSLRISDLAGRIGGDEFVALVDEATLALAPMIEHRFHRALESHRLPHNLGVSVGWSEFEPNRPRSLDELLDEADEMLFEAKRAAKFRAI